eukprot:CAMPEP_0194301040 /NCGR_PEP_ID=MMETSP0169-20130528/61584_1 /TAXON_ID=218684 /ORGANISM="Corethron pennatum, Strain L29A3" /LENGTH=259 /DNA_ID=CAMNT_0039051263 /DNA_START=178 /DNA_END=953 /DNA_ORIENTATION=+
MAAGVLTTPLPPSEEGVGVGPQELPSAATDEDFPDRAAPDAVPRPAPAPPTPHCRPDIWNPTIGPVVISAMSDAADGASDGIEISGTESHGVIGVSFVPAGGGAGDAGARADSPAPGLPPPVVVSFEPTMVVLPSPSLPAVEVSTPVSFHKPSVDSSPPHLAGLTPPPSDSPSALQPIGDIRSILDSFDEDDDDSFIGEQMRTETALSAKSAMSNCNDMLLRLLFAVAAAEETAGPKPRSDRLRATARGLQKHLKLASP